MYKVIHHCKQGGAEDAIDATRGRLKGGTLSTPRLGYETTDPMEIEKRRLCYSAKRISGTSWTRFADGWRKTNGRMCSSISTTLYGIYSEVGLKPAAGVGVLWKYRACDKMKWSLLHFGHGREKQYISP